MNSRFAIIKDKKVPWKYKFHYLVYGPKLIESYTDEINEYLKSRIEKLPILIHTLNIYLIGDVIIDTTVIPNNITEIKTKNISFTEYKHNERYNDWKTKNNLYVRKRNNYSLAFEIDIDPDYWFENRLTADINLDGVVDSYDLNEFNLVEREYKIGNKYLSIKSLVSADINKDGSIDETDKELLKNIIEDNSYEIIS